MLWEVQRRVICSDDVERHKSHATCKAQ
jgi:hypothetical protein